MKEILNNQYKNLFLWVPFILAFGGALYFSVGNEPQFHFPWLITILLGIIIYTNKNIILRIFLLFVFGFFYAMSFTHMVNTPQIRDSWDAISISGTIQNIDYGADKTRIIVQIPTNQIKSGTNKRYANIRISLPDKNPNVNIGDTVHGKVMLFHPSPRYAPASFDFARWAYFAHISATGFFKDYEIVNQHSANQRIRTYIHNKSNSFLTDALVLGYKKILPDNESQIWKSVGIGHVWAISGFHMTLVGGWLFALFYLIFRLIPRITKRIPAKYPAMICAWIGLLSYVLLSGISITTIRAFLMTTLIFIAVIIGRNILSLRNAALVFLIIFLFNPFSVMNAGFQLSFAAIFGLLWFYQNKEYIKRNVIQKIFRFVYLSLMTVGIATMFTLPFIIAHFGYLPIYSLIGNLILLPIFSFVIMPLIMIGTLCALFNWHLFLNYANDVYNFALSIAQYISNLPHANIHMPHMPNSVLILCIIGLACLVLIEKTDSKNIFIHNINYVLCGIFITLAITIYIATPKPLFYATDDNQLVGFVENGKIKFNKTRASKYYFAFDTWREFNNEEKSDKNEKHTCNHGLCRYNTPKWNLVYMQKFTNIMDNIEQTCQDTSVNYIISPFKIHATKCNAKILTNGVLIYPNGTITTIINRRPWHNLH